MEGQPGFRNARRWPAQPGPGYRHREGVRPPDQQLCRRDDDADDQRLGAELVLASQSLRRRTAGVGALPCVKENGLAAAHGSTFADIDGECIASFILGKPVWSHLDDCPDPGPCEPAVFYWCRAVRSPKAPGGAEFVPELVHNRSGADPNVLAMDLNFALVRDGADFGYCRPRVRQGHDAVAFPCACVPACRWRQTQPAPCLSGHRTMARGRGNPLERLSEARREVAVLGWMPFANSII